MPCLISVKSGFIVRFPVASWDPWDKMGNRWAGVSKYRAWLRREQLLLVCRWIGFSSSWNGYVKILRKKGRARRCWENAGWTRVMSLSSFHVSTTHRDVCLQVLEVTLSIWCPELSFVTPMPLSLCSCRAAQFPSSVEVSSWQGEEDSPPKEGL